MKSFPAKKKKQKKNNLISKIKKKIDLEDFEKLFIQPQSFANVVNLDLWCKLQKMKKYKKKKNKTNSQQIKLNSFEINILSRYKVCIELLNLSDSLKYFIPSSPI